MKPEHVLVVRAALITEQQEILVLRRTATDDIRPGKMDLPGGSQDPGDRSPVDAVVREVAEETGICLPPERFYLAFARRLDGRIGKTGPERSRFLFAAFLPEIRTVTLDPREHDDYQVIPLHAAEQCLDHPIWGPWAGRLAAQAAFYGSFMSERGCA